MKLTVKHVMTSTVVAVNADTKIDDVFSLLLRHHISGLPVVDDERRLVGVITELDLLRLLDNPETTVDRVVDYATTNVMSVTPDEQLPNVLEIFLTKPYRRLPVTDADGKLVGVVSRHDLIRFVRDVRLKFASALQKRREAEPAAH